MVGGGKAERRGSIAEAPRRLKVAEPATGSARRRRIRDASNLNSETGRRGAPFLPVPICAT